MKDRKVKLTLGFEKDKREVEITIPDDEPTPFDLNTKLQVMGKRHQKVDAVQKVTGRAKYTHDIHLPGMLYGGFVRCPHAKAKVLSIDLSEVLAHPEVKAAYAIGVDQTNYAGAYVAAVAAETRQGLEEALSLAKARYAPLPFVVDTARAMEEGAPQVHENRPNLQRAEPGPRQAEVDAVLNRDGTKVIEVTARTQVQTHCCLETHGAVAKWDGEELTVWTSTQTTFGVRDQLRQERSIPAAKVRVISEYMGGGFGSKFAAGYWSLAAARLSKMAGRPVKIMLDRHEEQTDTGNRPDSIQDMRLAVDDDGKIAAYSIESLGTPGVGRGAGVANPMIYDFPRELTARRHGDVAINAGTQLAFRAPGHPQGSFGLESAMDLAAEKAGIDPLKFRMLNDSNPVRRAQYEEGARRIGWSNRQPNGAATGRFRTGYGVGAATWGGMGGPTAEVLCRILSDGSVQMRHGGQDIGVGTRTILAILAAEELAIQPDAVVTFIGDTHDPIGPASGGSQTAASVAPAARQAAYLAGRELLARVAPELDCEPADLTFRDGHVVQVGGDRKVAFKDACRVIGQGEIAVVGKRKSNWGGRRAPQGTEDGIYRDRVAGVQFVKATVDCDFGLVKVDKVVAIQDCGLVINRATAEGQVFGGVIQGISYGLFEERVMDRHLGHMVNPDLEMYKIAGAVDMPEIECVLMDVANGGNNCSVAGIGEPTSIPTAAAIAGAVHNATGLRITSLPLTPDKILMAFEEGGK